MMFMLFMGVLFVVTVTAIRLRLAVVPTPVLVELQPLDPRSIDFLD